MTAISHFRVSQMNWAARGRPNLEVWQSGLMHWTPNPAGQGSSRQPPPWVRIPPPPYIFTGMRGDPTLPSSLTRNLKSPDGRKEEAVWQAARLLPDS